MAGKNGNKVFVRITNEQVYKELKQFKEDNERQHIDMVKQIESIRDEIQSYKGQVSYLKIAIGGIGILAMATLGWFIVHII